jgi:hypothetical protein
MKNTINTNNSRNGKVSYAKIKTVKKISIVKNISKSCALNYMDKLSIKIS